MMAQRTTFVYRVEMGYGKKYEHRDFCYARNALRAIEGMKWKYEDKKYTRFKAVPAEELKWLQDNRSNFGEQYAFRREVGA